MEAKVKDVRKEMIKIMTSVQKTRYSVRVCKSTKIFEADVRGPQEVE